MNMKKKYFIPGLAVLSVLAITAGASSVMAASTTTNSLSNKFKIQHNQERQELTEAQKTEMKTKIEAVETALTNGDYSAWVTAQKALDENCPALTKITADNFSKYVEANNLRKQADSIMKDLGMNGGGKEGMSGFGMGHGGPRGGEQVDAQQ